MRLGERKWLLEVSFLHDGLLVDVLRRRVRLLPHSPFATGV